MSSSQRRRQGQIFLANSEDLSAETTAAAPPRRQFRLTGPSVPLEPGRYAVRRDLAEIDVADRVFAQHYVEPMTARLNAPSKVYARPAADSQTVAVLATGDIFYLIDLGHEWAWGRGQMLGSTGYVPATALDLP
jgi:hypothetical protein